MKINFKIGSHTYAVTTIKAKHLLAVATAGKKLAEIGPDDIEKHVMIVLEAVAEIIGDATITADKLLDELELDEVGPLIHTFNALMAAVMQKLTDGIARVPNGESPAGSK